MTQHGRDSNLHVNFHFTAPPPSLLTTLQPTHILEGFTAIAMFDTRKNFSRRHPYRGKKQAGNNVAPRNEHSPQQPRVSTPPLTVPIPVDTPRFADLGKENLIHPVILQTITEDLKFDHMMPIQAATLQDLLVLRSDCLAQAKTGTGKRSLSRLPFLSPSANSNLALPFSYLPSRLSSTATADRGKPSLS